MKPTTVSLLTAAVLIAGCSKPQEAAPVAAPSAKPVAVQAAASAAHAAGIAWKYAANDAEVDAAFAQAKAETKPVFVYWGAKWCPPCNQVKATLFNRQDFIERSRAFVPVYVDGDSPGAQKLGSRFKVSGYPTMVLFSPQGTELTRLPGEVEAERYTQVLTLGMNAQRPVKEVLAQVKTDPKGLSANDWRLLAFYSWDTDQQQLVPKDGVPALLKQLADACPADQGEIATRLRLKALAAVDEKAPAHPDAAAQATLLALLGDASGARVHLDMLTNYPGDITRALSKAGTPQRAELLKANLAKSHSPYYLMSELASNAKKRGDKVEALHWYQEAFDKSEGPATRLQWGAGYVNTMIDLTPDDAGRIEKAAAQVIGELEAVPDTFYDRNRRALEKMARKLTAWNKGNQHQDSLKRIRAQLAGVCAQLPAGDPARATCDGVWNPPKAAPA